MQSHKYTAQARLIEPEVDREEKPETWAEFCARLAKDAADFKANVIASRTLNESCKLAGHERPVAVTLRFLVPGGNEWLVFGDQVDRGNFRTRPQPAVEVPKIRVTRAAGSSSETGRSIPRVIGPVIGHCGQWGVETPAAAKRKSAVVDHLEGYYRNQLR